MGLGAENAAPADGGETSYLYFFYRMRSYTDHSPPEHTVHAHDASDDPDYVPNPPRQAPFSW
jgi:hypothetical protein